MNINENEKYLERINHLIDGWDVLSQQQKDNCHQIKINCLTKYQHCKSDVISHEIMLLLNVCIFKELQLELDGIIDVMVMKAPVHEFELHNKQCIAEACSVKLRFGFDRDDMSDHIENIETQQLIIDQVVKELLQFDIMWDLNRHGKNLKEYVYLGFWPLMYIGGINPLTFIPHIGFMTRRGLYVRMNDQ